MTLRFWLMNIRVLGITSDLLKHFNWLFASQFIAFTKFGDNLIEQACLIGFT